MARQARHDVHALSWFPSTGSGDVAFHEPIELIFSEEDDININARSQNITTGLPIAPSISEAASMGFRRFSIYILLCNDGSYYTGITNDVERRFHEHQEGLDPSGYTHDRRPLRLVHVEEFPTALDAIAREKQLKCWSRAKKAALIRGDLAELSRLAHGHSSVLPDGSSSSP